jgi:hypothetical protein
METKNATPHTLGRQFQGIFFKHKITLSRDESLTRFSRGRKIVTRLSQGQKRTQKQNVPRTPLES